MGRLNRVNLLSRVLLLVVCNAAAISGTVARAGEAPCRFQPLLDALERIDFAPSHNALWAMEEHRAVRAEGVSILHALAKRYASAEANARFSVRDYGQLFVYIAGFRPYYYSPEPHMFGEIDIFESDTTNLPVMTISAGERPPSPGELRDQWLAWWERVQHDDGAMERLDRMREVMGHVDARSERLDSATWRAYERAAVNYGIFNLPAFVKLVEEDNNPVAFAELLRVVMHPDSLNVSEYALDPMGRVRAVAAKFPEHQERIKVIREWWEGHAHQFDALPKLKDEIEKSFSTGSKLHLGTFRLPAL